MRRTVLHNAIIVNEGSTLRGYVVVEDDLIVAVGEGPVPPCLNEGETEMTDLEGRYLLPGVIDTHVHFREPGMTTKGTIASESRAAVLGGVTSYLEMPNTRPATVDLDAWQWKMDKAASDSVANYGFFLGATSSNFDILKNADYTHIPGIKVFMGSSTGDMLMDDDALLRKIFTEIDAPVVVHAEDEATIRANRERAEQEMPDGVPIEEHSRIRSVEACLKATERAVKIARETGGRLHVAHISTGRELKFFPPLLDPVREHITSETCPQYLLFSERDYNRLGARIKCNPSIKGFRDQYELREGVSGESIDTIATDHAPHLLKEKEGDALKAVSGMPGVQFSLPLMLQYFGLGIVKKMTHNPARIFRIDRRGYIRPGYYADFAVVEHLDTPVALSDSDVASICGWTPYAGITTRWRVTDTMINGRWVVRNMTLTKTADAAMPLRFHNNDKI